MRSLVLLLLFLTPFFAFGYTSLVAKPIDESSVLYIKTPFTAQEYFGALESFPHTFTFDVTEETVFRAKLFALSAAAPKNDVSMLLVKQEERGVSDVARTSSKEASWNQKFDHSIGTTLKDAGALEVSLAPGTYTFEVSSPSNDSVYKLVLGNEEPTYGYFDSVQRLFEVHALMPGLSFGIVLSPLIYVPALCILLLLSGGWFFVRKSKRS